MKQQKGSKDVVDTELTCSTCCQRLYVPTTVFPQVFNTVVQGGTSVLVCLCGQTNIIYPHALPPGWASLVRQKRKLRLN
jgi:hypothetical protein